MSDNIPIGEFDLISAEIVNSDNPHEDAKILDEKLSQHLNITNNTTTINNNFAVSRSELVEADEKNLVHSDMSEMEKQNDLIMKLRPIFDKYKEKFETTIEYQDFTKAITTALDLSRNEAEIRQLIISDMVTNISDYVIIKCIIVAAQTIDRNLTAVQEKALTDVITPEGVAIVNQIFSWIDRMRQVKEIYKEFGIEDKIRSIKNRATDDSTETVESSRNRQLLIQQLLKSVESDRVAEPPK